MVSMRDTPEAEIVGSLKKHLLREGLNGAPVERIVVAADGTFIRWSQENDDCLEPIANVRIGQSKPDLVCEVASAEERTVVAFEVKARPDVGAVAQALAYRSGTHQSYVAFPDGRGTTTVQALASKSGVGLLVRVEKSWSPVLVAPRPTPEPARLAEVESLLRGASVARRLQLNHPLNYLAATLVAAAGGKGGLNERLQEAYPVLSSSGTIRHAIEGAKTLGLVDWAEGATAEGRAYADIVLSSGYRLSSPLKKNRRLVEEQPLLGAVARSVLLRQSAVQLVVEALRQKGGSALISDLAEVALELRPDLGAAVFLLGDPDTRPVKLGSGDFNPSAAFKLKQNMWHAGVLATKAHPTAAKSATEYRFDLDRWTLDERLGVSDLRSDR